MAHSFLHFDGRSDMMQDRDIFVIIGLLRAHLNNERIAAIDILDGWFFSYDEMPSGAINLDLDRVFKDEDVRSAVVESARNTLASLDKFDDVVPADWLSRVLDDGDGAVWNERPKKEIETLIERFLAVAS